MEPKTKKYLIWGGAAVVGLVLYQRLKTSDKSPESSKKSPKADKLKTADAAPQIDTSTQTPLPSTASQFSPVNFQSYSPPYVPPYTPPYVPPYVPQYPYTPPYIPPVTGYPYTPPYVPSTPDYSLACRSVIGMTSAAARAQLRAQGIYAKVVSLNGRQIPQNYSQPLGPTASLWVNRNIVVYATCTTPYNQNQYITGY